MSPLRHVFWLGVKELTSVARDPVLLLFIVYAFTLYVATAGSGLSLEVRNASVAFVDRDRSPASRAVVRGLRPPQFQTPVEMEPRRAGRGLESGEHTFLLEIPAGFERDLVSGAGAELQLLVDATAVSQAFLGATYIERIAREAVRGRTPGPQGSEPAPAEARVRVRFNPNLEGSWHVSVVELLFVVTLLSMVLPAAALLREREQGTVEHLLSLPLRPLELMLSKVWANSLIVLAGTFLSLALIVQGLFDAPFRGSWGLLLLGTLVYQAATAGLGMLLATLARSVAQVALLSILVVSPMMFLSGAWTPLEAMPEPLRWLTRLSPLRYYAELAFGVIFRGAGITLVWKQLAGMTALGAALFALGALRFRGRFAAASS